MSTAIKQNLFRFVTLRNPQLIENKENHKGFVFHPNESNSAFFNAIDGLDETQIQHALKLQTRSFSALKTKKEVSTLKSDLYTFSSWLMRNKNQLTFSEIKQNSNNVALLDAAKQEDILLWDNLIYQTITQDSVYVREAIIQMLVANQFLQAFTAFSLPLQNDVIFTEDQEKDFVRRANASVVLSKQLFTKATVSDKKQSKKLSKSQEKAFEKEAVLECAKQRLQNYKTLLKELKKVEIKYNQDTQKTYDVALKAHNDAIEQIKADAQPVIVEETDPKTGETTRTETYPDLVFPKFGYTKPTAVDSNYLSTRITEESLAIFEGQELDIYDDLSEVNIALNEMIQEEQQTIISNAPEPPTHVNMGGTVVTVNETPYQLEPYCFQVYFQSIAASHNKQLFLALGTEDSETEIVSGSYTLTNNNGAVYAGSNIQNLGNTLNTTKHLLFTEGILLLMGIYSFTGEFTLSNGVQLTFDVPNIIINRGQKGFHGCTEQISSTTPQNTTEDEVQKIYGVTNLGIADFRRVEQEVCCYVPGEVSHIENVMAREYKERSTRSLISSEITTERTDETERENLTDTTTTERNEMQSEAASVINEDQSENYGANASVHGGGNNWGFNIGAYADFSSSSSTSNSNSQALTYAQEVTERAMERIVSKTQTKRTSRILKEFEENNKHGFDNTKGEEHVTGVYRWIDKVYKNKLINYGKRLIYEFAIPEPSKFLKEAIIKKLENNQPVENGVILPTPPTHPSDYVFVAGNLSKVKNASFLNEDNYQELAAQYNAEVNAKPQNSLTLTKSFFETINVQGHASVTGRYYSGNDSNLEGGLKSGGLKIPEGYKCTKVEAQVSYNREGDNGSGSLHINMANNTCSIPQAISLSGNNFTLLDNASITDELNFSLFASNINILVFNIIMHCEPLDTIVKHWQNETYNAILNAYNERLREYNEAMVANQVIPEGSDKKLKFNAAHNLSLMKKELKRVAIELLIDQSKVSQDNYTTNSETTSARVIKNTAFQNHASTVKFFEQAFDWEIMAYVFYPYFYAKQDDWKDLFQQQDAADPIFQAFLQSGMARTVVPIRPGFEDAVNWYMSTGEIWNGQGLVVDQEDDLYVSIAEEMQTTEGEVEGTWETRLPTSLTVIQAGTIGLKVEGLPCDSDCDTFKLFDSDGEEILDQNGESFSNPIEQTNTLIGGTEPETGGIKLPPETGNEEPQPTE